MNKIVVNTIKTQHVIPKEIFGQFAEHLGSCIYGGIYVGEKSPIENVRGIRKDVVTALKNIHVPVIRWPGGCYADEYHWKDGVGPRDERPSMVNSNWGGVVEDNSFGTHEFLDLCEQVGAEPYINGNVGSGEVREMQEWIEYITCSDMNSSIAQLRSRNGHPEAWSLKWFGVGNENWGCGGNMCPNYYSQLYKRYQTFVRNYGQNKISKIACGPNVDDYHWMETLMKDSSRLMDYITLHYYTFDGSWENKGRALENSINGWHHVMANGYRMEELIQGHLAIMKRFDSQERVKLIVDEWGTWHKVEEGTHPGFLFQQNSIRDALLASMTLDIFSKHGDRIAMANIAQMVNVLQAMILTEGSKMVLTPTYHVFDFYKDHMDANYLDSWQTTDFNSASFKDREGIIREVEYPKVSMTASEKNGVITLTISNLCPAETVSLNIELYSGESDPNWEVVSSLMLSSSDGSLNSHNSFENPDDVSPSEAADWSFKRNLLEVHLPNASLSKFVLMKK